MIPAVYLHHDGETWLDAGNYSLALTAKFATLTRIRKPESFLPGAIDLADRIKVIRENWDAGKRRVWPRMAGVPLVFLASGAEDWKPPEDRITLDDIRTMF